MAKHLLRGVVAGMVGGLAASWVMNEFLSGPGKRLQAAVDRAADVPVPPTEEEDSTMKVADTLANVATGGAHLTFEQKQKAGPIIHYAFGALMGGIYGGLAEYAPAVKSGFGVTFATALFVAADVVSVPALNLGKPANQQDAGGLADYYAAHAVYGASTELVRRIVRHAL